MAVQFVFQYLDDDKAKFDAPEVRASFQPLFDRVDEVLPDGWLADAGLLTGFVEEYFEEKMRQAEEWDAKYGRMSVDELTTAFADGKLQWGEENIWTGPTVPFLPEELSDWASRWATILPQMPDEVKEELFTGDATVELALEELARCADMATCAKANNVLVTMSTRT